MKVLIADDHAMIRAGLAFLFSDGFGAEVAQAETLDGALEYLNGPGPSYDLALMDLDMPGMAGGVTLRNLREKFPGLKLAVVSGSDKRSDMLSALSAGVHGYFLKTMTTEDMASGFKIIMAGGMYVPPALSQVPSGPDAPSAAPAMPEPSATPGLAVENLTPRQRDVLGHLAHGKGTKEIARALDLAEGTVKVHVAALYRALGARSRSEAIALAARLIR
ncbi:response regulator [Lacibacterium aquatile]|uniref:Response regulator n=1 Tax=Lacibacterium aquatile TaxID=1168082 RepID=A0ABW5DRZ0_9PROT